MPPKAVEARSDDASVVARELGADVQCVQVRVLRVDTERRHIGLSMKQG